LRLILGWVVLAAAAALIALGASSEAQANGPPTIVIIRHGEKPDSGDNLSCQGLNRALQLPAVLVGKFGTPAYTYVPALKLGKSTNHVRMLQTVTPIAVQHNLVLNSKFAGADVAALAKDARSRFGLVLIVWDHSHIPALAAALGVQSLPKWGAHDFDSIWVIGYDGGRASLTIDGEGITPDGKCAF
jgi:hypothetical protein